MLDVSDTVPRRTRNCRWPLPLGLTLFLPAMLLPIEFIALLALVLVDGCASRVATCASSATTLISITFDCQTNLIDMTIVNFI
ncbi:MULTISPECIES: hypothetical protein [Burkholderia]|jgi:hypothetical protein|uniref:hypothetical protein n=1 Tax=Burkholderia TaxID=32008 RepID=UPI001582E078|nr:MULTISPECIES: hypothetical protein [Burkholderia]MBN3793403.1 hypothetical protein [Burkholderia sp. Ac-20392]